MFYHVKFKLRDHNPCYFLPLRYKYSPQHHILKHPQPTPLPLMRANKFCTHTKQQAEVIMFYYHHLHHGLGVGMTCSIPWKSTVG